MYQTRGEKKTDEQIVCTVQVQVQGQQCCSVVCGTCVAGVCLVRAQFDVLCLAKQC